MRSTELAGAVLCGLLAGCGGTPERGAPDEPESGNVSPETADDNRGTARQTRAVTRAAIEPPPQGGAPPTVPSAVVKQPETRVEPSPRKQPSALYADGEAVPPRATTVTPTDLTQSTVAARSFDAEVFACLTINDYNGNGVWEDGEFIGVGKRFRTSEHITLVVRFLTGQRGKQLRYRIRESRGFTVARDSQRVGYEDATVTFELPAGKLSPGSYTVEFDVGIHRLGVMPIRLF